MDNLLFLIVANAKLCSAILAIVTVANFSKQFVDRTLMLVINPQLIPELKRLVRMTLRAQNKILKFRPGSKAEDLVLTEENEQF